MAEYMTKVVLPAAGSATVGVPTNGGVLGIYSTSAVTISWVFNGESGQIASNVTEWEPRVPFMPGAFSALTITAAAAADVTIRMM